MEIIIKKLSLVLGIFSIHVINILGSGQVLPNNYLAQSGSNESETYEIVFEEEDSNLLEILDFFNQSIYNTSRNSPQAVINSTLAYDYEVNFTISNGSYTFTGGFGYETFKYIADSYGLQILSFSSDRYASTIPNSNNTDIGTMLTNDECDVAISAHEFNLVRLEKYSYLHPHLEARLWGYFVQPTGSSIRDIYHEVFAFDMWIAMLISWTIVVSTLCGITYIKQVTGTIQDGEKNSFTEMFFWLAGVACQNGYSMNPESISLKIAILCALWTGLLVYLSYSAAIVSILAWDMGITEFSEMVSSKFKFYCSSQSTSPKLQSFLGALTDKTPEIANERRIIKLAGISPFEYALTEEKSAFISLDDEFMQVFGRSEEYSFGFICSRMSAIIVDRSPSTMAMMVIKNSPWKEYLNIKLVWEMNNGILHRLRTSYRKQITPQCLPDASFRNEIHLGFKDIFSAIAILLILYAVSILCFVVEKSFALSSKR